VLSYESIPAMPSRGGICRNPSAATADVKVFKGSTDSEYSLKAEGQFSDSEPQWMITVDGISPTSGHAKDTITLFDMDSNQITLSRK
jgi:hypothetical protein